VKEASGFMGFSVGHGDTGWDRFFAVGAGSKPLSPQKKGGEGRSTFALTYLR
jgi:hypothetical protein